MSKAFKVGLLLGGDIGILYFSLFLTLLIRSGTGMREHLVPFTILFAVWMVIFYSHNLYNLTAAKNTLEFFTTLLRALVANFTIAVAFFYFIPYFAIAPKRNLFLFLGVFLVLYTIWRQFINRTLRIYFSLNTIVIGETERARQLVSTLNTNPQLGYRVSTNPNLPVQAAIVENEAFKNPRVVKELYKMIGEGIQILDLESLEEGLKRKVRLEDIDELWFLRHAAKGRRAIYEALKRLTDVVVSLLLFPVGLAVGVATALAIKLEDGGPIFYRQTRVGERGRIFEIIKFRTMKPDAEKDGIKWTKENDPRITRVGRILRRTRLDEFPQLINVLKGDISFVGPRSERPEFHENLKKQIPFYEKRNLIKPGFTGWAQINYSYGGASAEETREKIAYDFYYMKHRSLLFDLGIIARTIELVLSGRGR